MEESVSWMDRGPTYHGTLGPRYNQTQKKEEIK